MEGEEKTVSVDVDEAFIIKSDAGDLCRLCANTDNQLIPIFKGEGIEHNIPTKIEKHLPIIKVTEIDKLPLQICYQCASTLIAWHNLYEGCLIADKRLREILSISEKGFQEDDTFDNYVDDYRDDYDDQSRSNFDTLPLNSAPSTSNLAGDDLLKSNSIEISQLSESKEPNETELDNTDERCNQIRSTSVDKVTKSTDEKNDTSIGHHDHDYESMSKRKIVTPVVATTTIAGLKHADAASIKPQYHVILPKSALSAVSPSKVVPETPSQANETRCAAASSNIPKASEKNAAPGYGVVNHLYRCKPCGKVFADRTNCVRHLCTHQEANRLQTTVAIERNIEGCLDGEVVHLKESTLPNNVKIVDGYVICDKCPYRCKALRKHRFQEHYRIHTGDRPYQCELCGVAFRTKGVLKTHVRGVHAKLEDEFSCDVYDCKFAQNTSMEEHRRMHNQKRLFVCDLCGNQFVHASSMYVHKRCHLNVRDHKCEVCGAAFNTSSVLRRHMRRHTGDKRYKCGMCDKAFINKQVLQCHETVHSKERPFACEQCDSKFKLKKHLKQHERTHKKKEVSS